MSVAHEMWGILSSPPVPMTFSVMLAVLAWSLIFRKEDKQAWIMCATLIGCYVLELFLFVTLDPEAFRASLAGTDLLCAIVVLYLGKDNRKEWTVVVYATLVCAILLNVLRLFGRTQEFLSDNDHAAILTVLLGIRLLAIATPGIAYVGKIIGDLLPHHRPAVAVRHKVARN